MIFLLLFLLNDILIIMIMKACKKLKVQSVVHVSLSFAAGWLLDITKLKLGENIGEGEFGGELSFI